MTGPAPARVLLLDHTAKLSGGEQALLGVASALHGGAATARAIVFEDGPLVGRLRALGIDTALLPLGSDLNTTSRSRALSPKGLLRGAGALAGFVPRLARSIRFSGAELVVANSLKSAVFASLAAPLARRPWVWHLHDRLAADYLPRPLAAAMRLLATWGPRAIVVNSSATAATLPRRARAKATIAYPGLMPDAFAPAPAQESASVVGLIGRISPTKGQREFLNAAALIAAEHPAVRFRVVGAALFGEDEYEAEVRALPDQLGIGDRVEFTGWVADPGAQLRELTVLVHASPVPEPFGQVVVEAMAAGVPVIGAAAGGVPEILGADDETGTAGTETAAAGIRHTPYGVLVRPGDPNALARALSDVLNDPAGRQARAAAARRRARESFTIERTAAACLGAWGRALGSVRNPRPMGVRGVTVPR
ncbi:glycosyltransferase family 4 protein [Gryllotalpicola daejeonensis]|uniref:Glycosyltransferase family 4 protein n=1 Tax=Gryllotalpicola daejeonensis TaxID=993087 RepID=A0ABP7ZK45_9MICO